MIQERLREVLLSGIIFRKDNVWDTEAMEKQVFNASPSVRLSVGGRGKHTPTAHAQKSI